MNKIILAIVFSLIFACSVCAAQHHISANLKIYLAGVNKPIAEYKNVYYTLTDGCIHIFDKLGPGAHMTTYSLGAFGFVSEREE